MSYEKISLIVNIIAIVLAPIVAVVVGQMLQRKNRKGMINYIYLKR